jgi:hypothetical protein
MGRERKAFDTIEVFDNTEAANHPVAWFNALIRGNDRGDTDLIETCRARLKALGYSVAIIHPAPRAQAGEASR